MRILLVGGTGQVGQEFHAASISKQIQLVAPPRLALDLTDPRTISDVLAAGPWDVVINAAAYTEVDRVEGDEATALKVNAEGPSRLAAETAKREIPLIHISTDYVFDGRKGAPYSEQDDVAPLNAYGRTKLRGEIGVRAANPRHVILRSSWVFSPYGRNFAKTIFRLAAAQDQLRIVADQRGCPTAAQDLAKACLDVAVCCVSQPQITRYGTYHFAGEGEATWFEFAKTIIESAAKRLGRQPEVLPIASHEYPTAAVRPADTRLDCAAIVREFGVTQRAWREALGETMGRLCTGDDRS